MQVFIFQKYGKFRSILPGQKLYQKPLISEQCIITIVYVKFRIKRGLSLCLTIFDVSVHSMYYNISEIQKHEKILPTQIDAKKYLCTYYLVCCCYCKDQDILLMCTFRTFKSYSNFKLLHYAMKTTGILFKSSLILSFFYIHP